jgi:hypothetical protein
MWERIAQELGVETAPYPGVARPLEDEMRDAAPIWDRIVERHDLQPLPLAGLASWWHTDSDLGRPVETFADMTKNSELGFAGFRRSERSFLDLFARLKEARVIP